MYGVSNSQLDTDDFSPESLQSLRPTRTHMGLVALYQAGYLKFLCTQNIENLHRLSG